MLETSYDKQTSRDLLVRKRDGRVVPFNDQLIAVAMTRAFCAENGVISADELDDSLTERIGAMTAAVADQMRQLADAGQGLDVEQIQDEVERELMRNEFFSVARRYILYREEHARLRQRQASEEIVTPAVPAVAMQVNVDGELEDLDLDRLQRQLVRACEDLPDCSADELLASVKRQFYNGIRPDEIARALVLAARSRIERDPAYDKVAGRLVLNIIYREALGRVAHNGDLDTLYRERFSDYIQVGIREKRISPELATFDLRAIAAALYPERDDLFPYLGLQTIYDRYLLHIDGRRIEAPQYFWMRVAMGLAINEGADKVERAIEFYNILSTAPVYLGHADAVQRRNAASAVEQLLPEYGPGRSGAHLQGHRRQCAAVQMGGRTGQRLDEHSGHQLPHQGNQWPVAGRDSVSQGRQRHGRGGQSGGQTQGCGLFLSGILASGHRGVSGPSQKHRRRPAPDARHAYRQLDSRSVHETGDGQRIAGRCSARMKRPICMIWWVRRSRNAMSSTNNWPARARCGCTRWWRPAICGERC